MSALAQIRSRRRVDSLRFGGRQVSVRLVSIAALKQGGRSKLRPENSVTVNVVFICGSGARSLGRIPRCEIADVFIRKLFGYEVHVVIRAGALLVRTHTLNEIGLRLAGNVRNYSALEFGRALIAVSVWSVTKEAALLSQFPSRRCVSAALRD